MGTRPFAIDTDKTFVALCGERNGYIMLATNEGVERYADWPDSIFPVAKAWAAKLEDLGSPRAYWVTLSEEVRHLHIHIFPRWEEDTLKGIPLIESRETQPQPAWKQNVLNALEQWAAEFDVKVINPK